MGCSWSRYGIFFSSAGRSTNSMYAMGAESPIRLYVFRTRVYPPGLSLKRCRKTASQRVGVGGGRVAHEGRRGRRTREELDAVVLCPDETFGGSSRRVGVLLGQRDHAVGQAAQLLCLWQRGPDALVVDELRDHCPEHVVPVLLRLGQLRLGEVASRRCGGCTSRGHAAGGGQRRPCGAAHGLKCGAARACEPRRGRAERGPHRGKRGERWRLELGEASGVGSGTSGGAQALRVFGACALSRAKSCECTLVFSR